MRDYRADQRVVMTLDAGGTNFVFSAMRGGEEIVEPVHQSACVDSQSRCLAQIAEGFRVVKRVYQELSGDTTALTPKEIFEIAEGLRPGNQLAAQQAFAELGEMAGDAIAMAITLVDGLVVIGGGLSGAAKYILPALLRELNGETGMMDGNRFPRLQMRAYNLEEPTEFAAFAAGEPVMLAVEGSLRKVGYDVRKRIGVVCSRQGASRSIAMGAYVYALNHLSEKQ